MTDQEMRLASDSIAERMPKLVGEPLARYAAESFVPVYITGFAFGTGVSISSLLGVLAWKGLIAWWWALPFVVLAAVARRRAAMRVMIKHGLDIAADCDVNVTVHPTGYVEIDPIKRTE